MVKMTKYAFHTAAYSRMKNLRLVLSVRLLFLSVLLLSASLFVLVPTGVPYTVFAEANPSNVPPPLLAAASYEGLPLYAAKLAVSQHVKLRGLKMPQPELLITYLRGLLFSGRDRMSAYALEQAYVSAGIHGWENAVSTCFAKSKEKVTLADAATLVIHMRSPTFDWSSREAELLGYRNNFLSGIAENGYATVENTATVAMSPLVYCKRP